MIYHAQVQIDLNADLPFDTVSEYAWIGLDILAANTFACAVQILDANDTRIFDFDMPSMGELEFVRNVVRLSEIYAAAQAWRNAVQSTDGVRRAELRLIKLLSEEA
jgi:hypothetical protein